MKKLIIVLLIVAATVGTPYWAGLQIEAQLPGFLNRAAKLGQLNIELTSYDRGIFRSSAETTIIFQGAKSEKVLLRHSIWHGPLPIGQSIDGDWHITPAAAVVESTFPPDTPQQGVLGELLELLPGFGNFHEITRLSLAGEATSNVLIPPFQQLLSLEGNKVNFDWGGLIATEQFNSDLTRFEGEATLARIHISDPTMEGEVGNFKTTFRVHEDAGGLLLGNVTMDCDTIAFGPRDLTPSYSIKGFQLRNAARLNDDLASYAIEIAADELNNPIMTFAPVGFEVLFSRLDAETILRVQQELQKLQSSLVDSSENDLIDRVSTIYLDALPALIHKSPEISLNYLRARNADGELWAKGKITLSGEAGKDFNNLDELGQLIQAEGESQIDSNLLLTLIRKTLEPSMLGAWQAGQLGDIPEEQLQALIDTQSRQQIEALVTQGLLNFDGKNYSMMLSYQNRRATLNGQPLGQ